MKHVCKTILLMAMSFVCIGSSFLSGQETTNTTIESTFDKFYTYHAEKRTLSYLYTKEGRLFEVKSKSELKNWWEGDPITLSLKAKKLERMEESQEGFSDLKVKIGNPKIKSEQMAYFAGWATPHTIIEISSSIIIEEEDKNLPEELQGERLVVTIKLDNGSTWECSPRYPETDTKNWYKGTQVLLISHTNSFLFPPQDGQYPTDKVYYSMQRTDSKLPETLLLVAPLNS